MEYRIYVWPNFLPDHTDGLAVAYATSLEEAIAKVEEVVQVRHDVQSWRPVEIYLIREPMAFAVVGSM